MCVGVVLLSVGVLFILWRRLRQAQSGRMPGAAAGVSLSPLAPPLAYMRP